MAGLGRGLSSLLSESKKAKEERELVSDAETGAPADSVPVERNFEPGGHVFEISIEKLKPSKYQPRRNFDAESLDELTQSIIEHGLLEPLLVRRIDEDFFEIICGERRFRACKQAGLVRIPCLVRDEMQSNAYAVALIENIQREDLNPLELAQALEVMISECSLSQEELARTLGKSRSSISNLLRLNNLHDEVKELLSSSAIDLGHAKVLLSLDTELQPNAARVIVKKNLSVRETEIFVKNVKEGKDDEEEKPARYRPDSFELWEKNIAERLSGVKVKFSGKNAEKGRVTLAYSSAEQLQSILRLLELEN